MYPRSKAHNYGTYCGIQDGGEFSGMSHGCLKLAWLVGFGWVISASK